MEPVAKYTKALKARQQKSGDYAEALKLRAQKKQKAPDRASERPDLTGRSKRG